MYYYVLLVSKLHARCKYEDGIQQSDVRVSRNKASVTLLMPKHEIVHSAPAEMVSIFSVEHHHHRHQFIFCQSHNNKLLA